MNPPTPPRRLRHFIWKWLLACLVPCLSIFTMLIPPTALGSSSPFFFDPKLLLDALIIGTLTGLSQWWALRQYLPNLRWWVPVTSAGYVISLLIPNFFSQFLLVRVLGFDPNNILDQTLPIHLQIFDQLVNFIAALFIGIPQGFLLLKRLTQAWAWPFVNIAGDAVSSLARTSLWGQGFLLYGNSLITTEFISRMFIFMFPGLLISGGITGSFLVWKLRQQSFRW